MNTTQRRTILALVAASLLFALACSAITGGREAATPTPAAAQPTATPVPASPEPTATAPPATMPPEPTDAGGQKDATPEPTPPPAGGPGMACIGTFGYGVTCIEGGAWASYAREGSALGGDQVSAMAACPDGRVLIAHTFGISAYDGATWSELERGWGVSSVDALACDDRERIWVAHFKGVSVLQDGAWNTFEAREFLATGPDANDLVEDVAVAPDGTVWVATASSVARYDGENWQIFQEGEGFDKRYFFAKLAIDPDGYPWVAHGGGLFKYDGLFWESYSDGDFNTVESLAVDGEGRAWVGSLSQGVHVLGDGAWTVYDRENSDLSSNAVSAIAIDDAGRVWLGTEWGVNVVAGETWHTYRMDNADLVDHNVYALAVVGSGPELPPPQEKLPGALTGRAVLAGGGPLADATVEVCVEKLYSRFYGPTPCSDQPYYQSTSTDGEGYFTFADLPVGRYVITVQMDDGWAQLTTASGLASERVPVWEDEETDIGDLELGGE